MTVDRMTRINELIKREIGTALFRIMGEQRFDLSAVTVTKVITSPTLRSAKVLVSIRDHEGERDGMLAALRSHRGDLQKLIARNITLKYTPKIEFALDTSIEKGDHVLDILSGLDDVGHDNEDSPGNPSPEDPGLE
jgi:ribosome-binding factor A